MTDPQRSVCVRRVEPGTWGLLTCRSVDELGVDDLAQDDVCRQVLVDASVLEVFVDLMKHHHATLIGAVPVSDVIIEGLAELLLSAGNRVSRADRAELAALVRVPEQR